MSGWAFAALGTPAPQGSKSAFVMNGRARMVESSKKVRPWRDSVTSAALGAGPKLDGPVAVVMVFSMARPKSAPKRVTYPATYPDLSKLARSTEDAITAGGLWMDDARVAEYTRLAKVFAGSAMDGALPVPGVIVAAVEMGLEGPWLDSIQSEAQRVAEAVWEAYGGSERVSTAQQAFEHIAEIREVHSL